MLGSPSRFIVYPRINPGRFFYGNALLIVAFIQKFLFQEVFIVWLRGRVFEFRFCDALSHSFLQFFNQFPKNRAFDNIKSVILSEFPRNPSEKAHIHREAVTPRELIPRMGSLEHLILHMSSLSTTSFSFPLGKFTRIMSAQETMAVS